MIHTYAYQSSSESSLTLSIYWVSFVYILGLFYPYIRMIHTYAYQSSSESRPTTVSKETYYSVKRDLLQCQKRHTYAYQSSSESSLA
jgi:hypothetical protein